MSITCQRYSNKWFKRKWCPEWIKIHYVESNDKMKGVSYWTHSGGLIIDKGWITDVDCLHDCFKEVNDNMSKTLELLYE